MRNLAEWLALVGLEVEDPEMDDRGTVWSGAVEVLVVSPGAVSTQCAVLATGPVEPLEAAMAVDYEASAKLYPEGWPSLVLEAGAAL